MTNVQFDQEDELVQLRQTVMQRSTESSGSLLLRWKIVSTEEQARIVLIVIAVAIFLLALFVLVYYVFGVDSVPAWVTTKDPTRIEMIFPKAR